MRVDRRHFYAAMKDLSRLATHSIVSNVLLTTNGGMLSATTTDLTSRLSCELPVDGPGLTACLPAKLLTKLLKPEGRGPAGDVVMDLDGDNLALNIDGLSTRIPTTDPPAFPSKVTPSERWSLVGQCEAKRIRTALSWVLPAASRDTSREHLNSVFIDKAALVASDGHRLHLAPSPIDLDTPLLLPATSAAVLERTLKHADEALMARCNDELLWVRCGAWEFTTKLRDDSFPTYEQVIPARKTQQFEVVLDPSELTRALSQVMKLSPKGAIRLCINGAVTLSPAGNALGEVEVIVPTIENHHAGDDLHFGLDSKYLAEGIPRNADTAELGFSGPLDPLRIDLPDNRVAVIMPICL